ncbi:hypothetical protein DCAR_0208176 [Daucus carota subsp. sativus]|uniref:Uncharacterized protein n=1 Tax=Daucus carota subsp. sativus TaxID=79200 RepID=A0AAF0WGG5_DAUCS|nr:hypothetical protein DCAR_0208176 [Daucus carota subsp. sativus]
MFIPNRSVMDFDYAHYMLTEAGKGKGNPALIVALGNTVYLLDASNGVTSELVTFGEELGPLTSVKNSTTNRQVSFFWSFLFNLGVDIITNYIKHLIGKNQILTTGGMDGQIVNNDVRISDHINHTAVVKALAWCSFQANLLASGGGGGDRCTRFLNTHTGACLNTFHTGSHACSLLCNKNEREMLSSHDFT